MNADIRMALADAERALAAGDIAAAISGFVDAGDHAMTCQLWRSASRSYRAALELDLVNRTVVGKLAVLLDRSSSARDWSDYAEVLSRHREWPHIDCRSAQVLIDDRGAYVECGAGVRLLSIVMPTNDRVDAVSDPRWTDLPLAMAMLILRRAMWPNARDQAIAPMKLRVSFDGRVVVLDELGDWDS